MKNNFHGIDHIGLTVPDIEEATSFFESAMDAEILYDTYKKTSPLRNSVFIRQRLGIPEAMSQAAIRMLILPNGPGIELFEFVGKNQRKPCVPSDIGWQHVAFYVDDIYEALKKVEAAGGQRNSEPIELSGMEEGLENLFCYCLTPWGSTLELISYPSRQPYLAQTTRRKWSV